MTRQEWVEKCAWWRHKWPTMQQEYVANNDDYKLNIYAVLDAINKHCSPVDILMGDAGSISYAGPVALTPKKGQRLIFSPAQADMGWALPGAIGVSLASKQPVIAIIGDGSFMSNIQELAVVKQHNLNIKFIILNNNGYLSIKNTQTKYFDGRIYGTSSDAGLWFPSFKNIAMSFGIGYEDVRTANDLDRMGEILSKEGPAIIDCQCLLEQEILQAQALKDGKQCVLHDMMTFLSDEELEKEMVIKL
jgi:acetolactate synthase-1/2/3 large subunit